MLARLFVPQQYSRQQGRLQWVIGLGLSLIFAFAYGYLAMQKGFSADYVVQDDARHYLFWMERFRDANAFPQDLMADYLQSITPVGYKLLYRIASYCHIQPEQFAKVLPVVLGLVAAGYYYGLTLRLFPVPVAGVMASVMLSQHLWSTDDVVSATPRAFIYPLLIALLFYFVEQRWGLSLVCLGLLALFYPPLAAVATTLYVVNAVDWPALAAKWDRPWVVIRRSHFRIAIAAILLAALCILPTYLLAQQFGPVVTMDQARTLPEFQPTGRHSFFREGISRHWLVIFGGHGAILKRTIFTPVTLAGALLLPPMQWFGRRTFPDLRAVRSSIHVFTKLTAVSLVWFVIAYAVAFKLHMPGRYTSHCILLAMPVLAAIAWTLVLGAICRRQNKSIAALAVLFIAIPLFFYYPLLLKNFPKTLYMNGREAPIYSYLQTQPQTALVASLDYEADYIPIFAKRSTLIAPEYATPFHLGYYRQMRQRGRDLLRTHYTSNRAAIKTFVERYGIDFWLVNKAAFEPGYLSHHDYWHHNYPALTQIAIEQLNGGRVSLLQTRVRHCSVVETDRFWLASTPCLLDKQAARPH
ncbi:MAG: hypothetical protein AAF808_13135 [Cyanobacteria bacterium P01_D01_bin.2]